jgi:hypothetical protein
LAAVIAITALATGASARLVVGISDENGAVFTNPYFQALHARQARYITNYDSALRNPGPTDAWMAAARTAGAQVMVAFNPGSGGLPSVSQYTKAFLAFHKRYPFVKIYQPWNEVNSTTQPTWKKPQMVVSYYSAIKRNCKGCTVLGADIEDLVTPRQASYPVYIKTLLADFRKAHVPTPKVWGIHNYEDVNYFHSTNTVKMLKLLPGQLWLTETGGLAFFETSGGNVHLSYSLSRQDRATNWMMKLALRYPKRIGRVYIYNFLNGGPPGAGNRFDSALLGTDGLPRPAWKALFVHWRGYFR